MRASWVTAMFLVFTVGLLLLAGGVQITEASGYGEFSAFGRPVTIGDGTVNPDASIDWGDAAKQTYEITFKRGDSVIGSVSCNVYVKNDETYLYMRVEWVDPDRDPSGGTYCDTVSIYFDDQDSDGLGDYDDCARITDESGYGYLDEHYGRRGWIRDNQYDGYFDYYWDENSKRHIIEFAKPLKSQEGTYDFDLTFGESIKFAIKFQDGSSSVAPNMAYAWLPDGFEENKPDTWDPVIVVAAPPRRAPVGGVEAPINTLAVLAHSPLSILALVLVLASSAIITTKRAWR